MTFNKITASATGTEPAPQSCDSDPFRLNNLPSFLRRTPEPAKPADAGEANAEYLAQNGHLD